MVVSPQLLALMSITPTRSGGVTSWSILMDFRYPYRWETVSNLIVSQKAKGPPDDMVTLEVDDNIFKYVVRMPWYARLALGKTIVWHDIMVVDPDKKILSEDGININLRKLGTVRDVSTWRACDDDPEVTLYKKRIDLDIRMPLGPTIMMQVAQPLIRWFETKSKLCRELEVEAIKEQMLLEERETEEERTKRRAKEASWMQALIEDTATPTSSFEEFDEEDEDEDYLSDNSPSRMAKAKAKAQSVAATAKAAGANAAERSRSRTPDGSSVTEF